MGKITLVESPQDCCGCGACLHVCSQNAISFEMDDYGHLFPNINDDLCVECKACLQNCIFQKNLNGQGLKKSLKQTFVGVSRNTDLFESASGGIFASIAALILKDHGIVYGSELKKVNDNFTISHSRVDDLQQLYSLKGSKYVQSDMRSVYTQIYYDLKQNELVLFSGTPCQIAGLKGFLRQEYDNLFTVEIICHGVPSVNFFNSYIKNEELRYRKRIENYRFRDKSAGWKLQGAMELQGDVGKETVYFEPEESSYYQLFLDGYTYRESCYSCPYASGNRAGDVTIGDYWGIELVHPELFQKNFSGLIEENKGVSCLVINNQQGSNLIDRYGKELNLWKSTYEKASRYNGQLKHPSVLKPERERVKALYMVGYDQVEAWYRTQLRIVRLRRRLIGLIPKPIKNIRRKILGL